MATGQDHSVIRCLTRAAFLQDAGDMTDGQLLERFLAAREEAAFEVLLRRHGPMVLGVCLRVLSNAHDVEDAFQAVFLVLIRKGPSLLPRQTLGNWLYGVAYHTALKARAARGKRRAKERQAAAMRRPESAAEDIAHDLSPLLDQELSRLPDKYREAVVLCELERKTREEAARQLRLPVGTLSGRLTTARRMLARRLTRRGVMLSGAALATALAPNVASANVPPALLGSTLKAAAALAAGHAATGVVSAEVVALAHGMLKSMLLTKLKLTMAVLLAAAALGGGTGAFAYQFTARTPVLSEANRPSQRPNSRDAPDRRTQPPPERPGDKAGAKPSDKELLQGAWIPIGSVAYRKKTGPGDATLQRWTLVFDGDHVTIPDDRTVRYTLDAGKNPKRMDILGKDNEPEMLVIYELEGDKLKFSFKKTKWRLTERDRPTDFDTAKNESVLIVLKRRKAP
jgi:RNA polymerase sigma factor (sigma-70 family)